MRYAWVLGLLTLCVHSALAQNRPNIRWNIDAISGEVLSVSLTEQRDYLLLNEDGHAKLHRIDWLLQTRPLGTALVSYWLERGGVIPNLTDRCDTANGQEYIWWFTRNNVQVSRLIRSATTYGGAYLERKITTLSVGIGTSLALRGNTSQRAYNRLAALGLTNGNLRLVSVREPSNPADPLVIQNELEIAAHSGGVTAIAYDAGTRRLVTGGVDGLVRVWQLSGSLGALTLTPVSVFANGWGAVTGLNFASNSANQQLLITASDSLLVSGRLWNGGAPPLIPAWQTYIDPDAIADYSFFSGETRRLRIAAPEPSSRLIPVLIRTDISNEGDPCVLLDPDTGDVMYHFVWTAVNSINAFGDAVPFFTVASGSHYGIDTWGNLYPLGMEPHRVVGTHAQPATAVRELNGFLAVGYADGLVRVYQRAGNAWNLVASNTTAHANARIVAVFWTGSGANQRLISVDTEGRLRAWTTSLGSPTAQLNLNYEIADADFRSGVIALIGQEAGGSSGAPKASLVQFTGAALNLLSQFTPQGSAPSVAIRFVLGDGSLITLTTTIVGRWSNNYAAPSLVWGNLTTFSPRTLMVGNRALVESRTRGVFASRAVSSGSALGDVSIAHALARTMLWLGEQGDFNDCVWGASFDLAGGAYYHQLRRGVLSWDGSCLYLNTQCGATLPDEPLAVARDSAAGSNRFYVACADGSVVQVALPALQPRPVGYRALSNYADLQTGRIANGAITMDNLFGFSASGCGLLFFRNRVARFSTVDGGITDSSVPTRSTAAVPNTRLSPAGGTIYTQQSTTVAAWSGANPINQLGSASVSNLRAILPLSDTQVATLVPYQALTQGSNILWGWRLELRNTSNLSSVVASINLVDGGGAPLHSRWNDPAIEPWATNILALSASALRFAALGYRADPTNPSGQWRRRISVWQRPNTASWGWSLLRGMEQGIDWSSNLFPTSIDFHFSNSNLLYVGMNNGEVWRYDLSQYTPNPSNPRTAQGVFIYTPTFGNPGEVSALDTGLLSASYGYNYTILAFGGGNGVSIWVSSACESTILQELGFYNIDAQFDWISLSQRAGNPEIDLVYGTPFSMTAASIPEPGPPDCLGDVNRDSVVDDADLLRVLFRFGAVDCACPEDINCDGVVDDADLLTVLFNFGNQC